MYVSLYRRYRPQDFSDVVGQTSAVAVLQQSLNEKRIGHAYLFSGPRGCGKTSIARILAKALNCLSPKENSEPCCECANCTSIAAGEHLDVIEIDGASNRGINEIRDLKSRVNLNPLNAVYKIYIIDEVHMLTEQAFNALLKTLEEPPANVVFILATTEPNKVPVTIRSRCQHIPFHRISMSDLVNRVAYICEREGVNAEKEAIWEVARQADGALRDALSITEQAVALGNGSLTLESLKGLLGGSSRTELEELITLLRTEPEAAAKHMHEAFSRGVSVETFAEAMFNIYRDLWMYSLWKERSFEAIEVSEAEHDWIAKEAANWKTDRLKAACQFFNKLMPRAKYGMKTEIFTGLVLLGLTKISAVDDEIIPAVKQKEVKTKTAEDVQTVVREDIKPVREQQFADDEISIAAVSEVLENEKKKAVQSADIEQQEQGSVKPAVAEKTENAENTESNEELSVQELTPFPFVSATEDEYDDSALCGQLSAFGEVFAKLAEAFPVHRTVLCAALLDAELIKDGEGWKIEYLRNGKNEYFLKNPENSELLANAVNKIFGFTPAVSVVEEKAAENFLSPEIKPTEPQKTDIPPQNVKQTPAKKERSSGSSIDRMLKLAGANILYVEDENSEVRESDAE